MGGFHPNTSSREDQNKSYPFDLDYHNYFAKRARKVKGEVGALVHVF